MPKIVLNGQQHDAPDGSVADFLRTLKLDPKRLAVEVNHDLVPRTRHDLHQLQDGDEVEIVTLVGGGGKELVTTTIEDEPLQVAGFSFRSRLITGSGKYSSHEVMRDCLDASDCEVLTVAVRRERLFDKEGRSLLDFVDLNRYTILPNTAGSFSAEDAIRHARLGREILAGYDNPGARWVKLECLGDAKTLLPDPVATLEATKQLVRDGFAVMVYTSDDPITARRLKDAGAACVMPAGSPIGSGQGVLNPNNIRIILEYLKTDDLTYPVIIDAGVGTASDVSAAMELGCDGVLLNSAIALAQNPVKMAWAMRYACQAGRLAYLSGRIPKKLYATASSPLDGLINRSK
jgi:thiazole synthase